MFIDSDDLFYAQLNGSSPMNPVIKTLITGFVRRYRIDKNEHVFAAMFRGAARLSPTAWSGDTATMVIDKFGRVFTGLHINGAIEMSVRNGELIITNWAGLTLKF